MFCLFNFRFCTQHIICCAGLHLRDENKEMLDAVYFFSNFQSSFEAIQKVHFRIDFGADVGFVWIFFNASAKGRKKRYSLFSFSFFLFHVEDEL